MPPLNACLLVNGDTIQRWEQAALEPLVGGAIRIETVLTSRSPLPRPRRLSQLFYFALRLTAMRSDATQHVGWRSLVAPDARILEFEPEKHGNWERIPAAVVEQLRARNVDVIVKFGRGLLRDPEALPSRLGVLSFHHGDPSRYRGRPAGFYEILAGEPYLGVMVQRLSNKLDGGRVVALGRFKLYPHSYQRTLREAYWGGAPLLRKALDAVVRGEQVPISADGKL